MAERDIALETLLSVIRSRRVRRFLTVTTSVLLLLLGTCYLLEGSPVYWSDRIRIRVVDEETDQPVAGVVAFARWEGEEGFGGHRDLHVEETVSDQNGWLTLPGWRIVRTPLITMDSKDPVIKFYKPDAYEGGVDNFEEHQSGHKPDPWRIYRVAFWNGKTVPLKPLKTAAERVAAWHGLDSDIDYRRIDPKRLPLTWQALVDGYLNLPSEQRNEGSSPVDKLRIWSDK
jgi:hypothetical protein